MAAQRQSVVKRVKDRVHRLGVKTYDVPIHSQAKGSKIRKNIASMAKSAYLTRPLA